MEWYHMAGTNHDAGEDEEEFGDADATHDPVEAEEPLDDVSEPSLDGDSVQSDAEPVNMHTEPEPESEPEPEPQPPKGPDEVYCTSCGEPIKEEAEICPHCGVRQQAESPVQDAPADQAATPTTSEQQGADGQTEVRTEVTTDSGQSTIPEHRLYELQKVARKDITTVMLVSFLITPVGYWMVGKRALALINFVTLNYFLTGFIVVPFHTRKIIKDSRRRLEQSGHRW